MSIYFDLKIPIPPNNESGGGGGLLGGGFSKRIFLDLEWHREYPLLAMSHSDEKNGAWVSIYDHETEETANVDSIPSTTQITVLKFHPKSKFLALGYETGEVIVWNHEEGESFEGSRGHGASIMLMEWSWDGHLLISSDNMGILIIWKSDSQGHLQTHFIHDFKDPVCHIAFREPKGKEDGGGLVKNDSIEDAERALGTMTSWRPKTGRSRSRRRSRARIDEDEEKQPEERSFFVGVLSGTIYYLRESGSNEEILSSGSSIRSLLYHVQKEILVILTEAQIMGHFKISLNGDLNEVNKMKVGGRGDMRLYWVGQNAIAVLGRDPILRLWDIETGENSILEPRPQEVGDEETFQSLDYQGKGGLLCCCTNKGKLVMWKEKKNEYQYQEDNGNDSSTSWDTLPTTLVPSSSKSAKLCPSEVGVIAVNALQDVYLLKEQKLCFHFSHQVSIVQTQPNTITLQLLRTSPPTSFDIKVDMQVKGATSSESHVAIWNGTKIMTYEFGPQTPNNYKFVGSFQNRSDTMILHELSLYMLELGQIQVRSFQGTIKQTLPFTPSEGPPILVRIGVGSDFLTSASENGFLKIWHIGRREAKLHTAPKNLAELITNLGEIMDASANCDGTKVAFTVAREGPTSSTPIPNSSFYILDLLMGQMMQELVFPGRFVPAFFWEAEDPYYLCLEAKNLSKEVLVMMESIDLLGDGGRRFSPPNSRGRDGGFSRKSIQGGGGFKYLKQVEDIRRPWTQRGVQEDEEEAIMNMKRKQVNDLYSKRKSISAAGNPEELRRVTEIDLPSSPSSWTLTFFADTEKGILVHEKKEIGEKNNLVGLQVPYIFIAEEGGGGIGSGGISLRMRVHKNPIPEFDGVDDEGNKEGRMALMKYVYHTLFNDIDGALRAIRFIQNEKIYSNMVRNCIKTKRMDVALLSLAKMKEARIAKEVRDAMESEPELEAHVAMLAVQLGMLDEAEQLYISCNRYDLLLEVLVASEQWDKALELCHSHRRIQLRPTHHAHAKSLEYDKKTVDAIESYEKAETHRYEVPRMLVDDPDQLHNYVVRRKDKELYQWWAQYLESSGDVESALRYYELAHDWLSLVRLLCFLGSYEKAVAVANKVQDKASCYQLARTLEDNGEVHKAIRFFCQAGAYGHGIRMCIAHLLPDELWTLALKGSPSEQAEAAKYFETGCEPPQYDRAIQLYHKAGYDSKALDLAFSAQEFAALQIIVRDIMNNPENVKADPLLLQKCADFFVQNDEIEKALDMLCAAHKYTEAMDLCVQNNFIITEEMAERLTAPKGVGLDEATRTRLLEKMGESCTIQGNYHLAAKKYTQAGNKIEAIKSLIKSGDTEKIIFYANVSRHRDIYMIAAHYLQTTNLLSSPKIVQTIIQFYTKAQALESLSGFYETVAESYIETDHNYPKALDEYRKALQSWKDLVATGARQWEDRLFQVERKIASISKFIKIKDTLGFDEEKGLNELRNLVESTQNEAESGVRPGDVFGLIVEHYVNSGQIQEAIQVLEQMRHFTDGKSLTNFLSRETTAKLETVLESSNLLRARSGTKGNKPRAPAKHSEPLAKQRMNVPSDSDNLLAPFLSSSSTNNNNIYSEEDDEETLEEGVVEEELEEDEEVEDIIEEDEGEESSEEDGLIYAKERRNSQGLFSTYQK